MTPMLSEAVAERETEEPETVPPFEGEEMETEGRVVSGVGIGFIITTLPPCVIIAGFPSGPSEPKPTQAPVRYDAWAGSAQSRKISHLELTITGSLRIGS
jgi:hypothetical protein